MGLSLIFRKSHHKFICFYYDAVDFSGYGQSLSYISYKAVVTSSLSAGLKYFWLEDIECGKSEVGYIFVIIQADRNSVAKRLL